LDAFTPYLAAYSDKGKVGLHAADEEDLDPDVYERIDLLVFGPAKSLEVGEQGKRLKDAIAKGDAAGVRAAIKAGADLTVLPESASPPLQYAIGCDAKEPQKWVAAIRALLEGGADASGPAGANPPICELANESFMDLETMIEGMGVLLDAGADPAGLCSDELQLNGSTAVHILAQTRGATPLKFLHARGVDVLGIKDSEGKTPMQACEASLKRMKEFFGKDFDGSAEAKDSIAYLKSLQKGTASDEGYEEAAAEDRKAQQRKRDEAAAAFKNLGDVLKAAGKAMRKPTAKNLASLAVLTQPQEIHVRPGAKLRWANAKARDADEARLKKEGFERIGLFGIEEEEMEGVRMLAMVHPEMHVYAAVSEMGKTRWIDLVRFHKDGTRLTVTNAKTMAEVEYSSKRIRKVRLPGAGVGKLIDAVRGEKVPKAGAKMISASREEFAIQFEAAYREEMAERRGRGG
jgi:hypothetical protein